MTQEGMPLRHVRKCEKVGDVIRKIPRKNCRFAAFGMGVGYAGKGSMGFVSRHCRMGAVITSRMEWRSMAFFGGELL